MKRGIVELKGEISSDLIKDIKKKVKILDYNDNLILIETNKEWDEVGNYIVSIIRKSFSS